MAIWKGIDGWKDDENMEKNTDGDMNGNTDEENTDGNRGEEDND